MSPNGYGPRKKPGALERAFPKPGKTRARRPLMAPELMKKESTYTEQVDIYSFGIVAWELISKDIPFKHLGFSYLISEAVLSGERPLIPETCPEWFANLIKRSWVQEPNERPSFSDLSEELEQQVQTHTSLLSLDDV
jgi:serine/threonine protein kinase